MKRDIPVIGLEHKDERIFVFILNFWFKVQKKLPFRINLSLYFFFASNTKTYILIF